MAETDNEAIDLACRGLEVAVIKFCRKRKRDSSPAMHVVNHACHLLRQLTRKRRSLAHAVSALETCWKSLQLDSEDTTALLTHVFHQYLRLRDGMNLMTSGECRHPGDVREAKKTQFPSQFRKLSHQNDGYTTLYSSKYYSGYGWDEFYNPTVGIKRRLLLALGKDCWDTLLEYGAQAFESSLDQHAEVELPNLSSKLDQLRATMIQDLERVASNVNMVTLDKMERLELVKGGKHFTLERRANDFQVQDPNGCLPNNWSIADWNRALQYVPQKKRLVIQDSDDEEPGLRVRVKKKKTKASGESLTKIKEKCHVNAQELQESREWLEAEEAGHKQPEEFDEISELKQEITEGRTKVEFLQRVLTHLKDRENDKDEVRAQFVGHYVCTYCSFHIIVRSRSSGKQGAVFAKRRSHLISLCTLDEVERGMYLTEAQRWFCKALELVKKQESVHETLSKQSNDFTKESRADCRQLLLLRGRAHANIGTTLVRLSLIGPENKDMEREAMAELESAQSCAGAIRASAATDETPSETAIIRVEADQLDSLTNRWLGNSLWHQKRRKEAVLAYERSSRFFVDSHHRAAGSSNKLAEAEMALGIDCFYACISLADVALEALEKLQIVVQGHPRREESLAKGEELFTIASDAYKRASLVSANMQKLANHGSVPDSVEEALRTNDILGPEEIEVHMNDISDWWDQKRQGVVLRPKDTMNHAESNALRNDLFASGRPLRPLHGNSDRYTVHEGSSRGRRRNQGGHTSTTTRIHDSGGDGVTERRPKNERKFRKWGDELLPQVTADSGATIPMIVYPACAPILPLDCKPYSFNE